MLLFFPFHFGSGEDCGAAVSTGVRFTLTYSADRLETLLQGRRAIANNERGGISDSSSSPYRPTWCGTFLSPRLALF
ncbi:hypothetical protein OUZ56_028093 [Daphnia magna]|uniref:Secreted protein n=1 Tax=Daphnia magna TaxID=35525 RepID=A0ABR0B2W0_9CRUS|nr:hypothetical protein OUZ56_028093 [Daphnia magna]